MTDAHHVNPQNPTEETHSFASSATDLKDDAVKFVQTRVQLLLAELREKLGKSKKGAAFAGFALVFGSVGFLLLTLAAVGLVAVAFWGSPFAFFWGFLIIGIFYVLLAGMAAIAAYYSLHSLLPNKTIKVLQDDKTWLQTWLSKQS